MVRRTQAGFTIIELLVVLVLVGIIGGFVTTTLVRSMQVSRTVSERSQAIHDLERSLQTITRELRIADPIYLAADGRFNQVIGAAVYRDRTVQVHTFILEPETNLLFQEISIYDLEAVGSGDPLATTPTELPRRRLIGDVDVGVIFTYYADDGDPIHCTLPTPSDCEDVYADANQIGIRLVRNLEGQEPIRAETRVNLRNTRYGRVS